MFDDRIHVSFDEINDLQTPREVISSVRAGTCDQGDHCTSGAVKPHVLILQYCRRDVVADGGGEIS